MPYTMRLEALDATGQTLNDTVAFSADSILTCDFLSGTVGECRFLLIKFAVGKWDPQVFGNVSISSICPCFFLFKYSLSKD